MIIENEYKGEMSKAEVDLWCYSNKCLLILSSSAFLATAALPLLLCAAPQKHNIAQR